ncbi:DUF4870 domain-containing protein [Svornostia abyssi]|uniref:DUF4870 domain-containing protein n=1 Tax=Svornostia abyssi TaxID=2898438 RepID=A0ABY5PLX4_9ACTN|nr:DUF4870 domain-containing protein [Parviterribacteraceae bacterium J379]
MATEPPQQPPPPGWYPDAQTPGAERWWDGVQWTANQRPVGGMVAPPRPMSPSDEKTWAVIAHLSALAALFIGFPFLGPLIVYLVKRDESPYVRAHAAASLNFQISWAIWFIVLGIATFLLIFFIVGFLLIPVIIVAAIAWVVFIILASVKANNGEPPYNYPLTITFVS